MPELPEVETTVRAINKFENQVLKRLVVHNRNLRWKVEKNIESKFKLQEIKKISRRAKYIIIYFKDFSMMIHLGMSGKLRIQKTKDNYFKKHDHVELIFSNEKIIFNDPRRFGSLHYAKNYEEHSLIKCLGIEPLSKSFNKKYLKSLCVKSNLCIKKLIMDQKKIVGVGNIYACESLFIAKINPEKISNTLSINDCERLTKAIKKILLYAIKEGGTTLKDFYSADGSEGYFNLKLSVYGRNEKLCKKCKSEIKKVNIGQRATFYCMNCQT